MRARFVLAAVVVFGLLFTLWLGWGSARYRQDQLPRIYTVEVVTTLAIEVEGTVQITPGLPETTPSPADQTQEYAEMQTREAYIATYMNPGYVLLTPSPPRGVLDQSPWLIEWVVLLLILAALIIGCILLFIKISITAK